MPISELVPIESRSSLKTQKVCQDWSTFLRSLMQYVDDEDRSEEIGRHRKWTKSIHFYRGHQVGYVNPATGLFQDVPVPQSSHIRVNNILRYFVDNIVKEVVRSQATIIASPKQDTIAAQSVARLTKAVLEDIQKKTWTPSKRQAESKYTLLCGNSFRYNTYTYANSTEFHNVPKYSNVVIQPATSITACSLCGIAESEAGSPPPASDCNHQFETHNIPEISVPQVVGEDRFPVGNVVSEVVDPMEVKLQLHARSLEESPYLRRSRLVLRDYLEGLYDWANITAGTADTNALATQAELERLTGSGQFGTSTVGGEYTRQARFDEYWFEPVLYGSYVFPKDTRALSGAIIPSGTRAIDLYPNGMYLATSEGVILEEKDSAKNDYWVHVVWNKIPGCIYGDGIDDAVEKQSQHNDAITLVHDNLMSNTAPPLFYNPVKVNRGQLSGKPGHAVPLKNATPTDNPANYIYQMQTRSLGSEVHQVLTEQKQDMAMMVGGAFSSLGTSEGSAAPSTATGLAIVRDAALSHLAPFLELKSEADITMARQWLKLIKKYQIGSRSITTAHDYTDLEKKYFSSSDITEDLDINIRPGSVAPRTDLELRNDVLEAMNAGGLPLGIFNPQMPQKLRRLLADRYNIPFDADETAADERKQQIEIEDMYNILKAGREVGLAYDQYRLVAAEKVMVDILVDNHDVHIQYIIRYLKSSDGLAAPDEIKMILHEHIKEHLQAKLLVAQMANGLAIASAGADPSQISPQTADQANKTAQPTEKNKSNSNDVQARQAQSSNSGQSYDTRPEPVGEVKSGAKRVTPVTQRPHSSQAPQPT
jgi:hypothetical protein